MRPGREDGWLGGQPPRGRRPQVSHRGPSNPLGGIFHRCGIACVLYPGISTTLHMFLMKVESIYGLLEAGPAAEARDSSVK
jgi:hypothetical protein